MSSETITHGHAAEASVHSHDSHEAHGHDHHHEDEEVSHEEAPQKKGLLMIMERGENVVAINKSVKH